MNTIFLFIFSMLIVLSSFHSAAQIKVVSNGNVGIGTSSPGSSYKLDVNGNLRVRGSLIYGNTGNFKLIAGGTGYVEVKSKSPSYGLIVREYNSNDYGNVEVTATGLGFSYNSSVAHMTIEPGGFVGVGTTNPVSRFHVANGRVEFSSATDANGSGGTGVLEIANSLRLDGNEIITNTNSILYLQNDNNGDLRVDASTLVVDASTNRVGIGYTAPAYKLDVNGNIRTTILYDGNNSSAYCNPSATSRLNNVYPLSNESGYLGSTSNRWRYAYVKYFYRQYEYSLSDRNLKENIRRIESPLQKVLALDGKMYDFKATESDVPGRSTISGEELLPEDQPQRANDTQDRFNQLGFIAQDVQKILPEVVKQDEVSGAYMMNYEAIIPVLVEAVKAQQLQIDELRKQIGN